MLFGVSLSELLGRRIEGDHGALLRRYQRCAERLWDLFDRDPLGSSTAHSNIERLEALLDRGLIGPQRCTCQRSAVRKAIGALHDVGLAAAAIPRLLDELEKLLEEDIQP